MIAKRMVPFEAWHLQILLYEGAAEIGFPDFEPNVLQCMEMSHSFTLIVGDFPVLCGGTIQQWPGRHTGWAFLNRHTGQHMLWTTRRAREVLGGVKGRIEITVREDFPAGHRWARMLGFDIETPLLKAYGPMGEDHVGYVRFN